MPYNGRRYYFSNSFPAPVGAGNVLIFDEVSGMNEGKGSKRWWYTAFIAYVVLMYWLLFGRRTAYPLTGAYNEALLGSLNLRPFRTIRLFFDVIVSGGARVYDSSLVLAAYINIFGNVVMFAPFGFFLPRLFPRLRRFWRTLLCAAVLVAAVEVVQLLTRLGSCDIDDLLLNLCGVTLGYLVFWLFAKRRA